MITSMQNQWVKLFRKLHVSKHRHELNLSLVEGSHLVEEAIVYRTEELAPESLGAGEWFVVFASPSAVRAFAEANAKAAITALAIGETTGAACRDLGWPTRVSLCCARGGS